MLEGRRISFSYDGLTPVLNLADLFLKRGEVVLLSGPTGSGKSTLAKCLSGFIPRSIPGFFEGEILLDSTDTQSLPLSEISRRVALVQQDPDSQICTLRVSDEVAFGPENFLATPEQIQAVLDSSLVSVGADHLADRPTYSISGGEKQRVTIAAVLSCQPDFMILDEPSANLDPSGILLLRRILLDLKEKGVGVLCIEHNLDAIGPAADRVLWLEKGRIESEYRRGTNQHSEKQKSAEPRLGERALLIASQITFSYTTHTAVEKVNLSVKPGEVVALMGDNGSGKTTLILLLAGLLTPQKGTIQIGKDFAGHLTRSETARRVSVVFQNPNHQIFERTVLREQNLTLENLGMDDPEHMETSAALLAKAGLAELDQKNPFSLSHGQKRRLNVTSVLAHQPDVLLLDEPFVGQDFEGRQFMIDEILQRASAGSAAVVVTHDSSFALTCCSRIVFMQEGSILLDGKPEVVFRGLGDIGRSEYLPEVRE
jgi:energy-coupling factor transporter ATP-binding protein EcfA2